MDPSNDLTANPGYAIGRLAKAFHTGQTHEDPDTRARAERKIATWIGVIEGMLSGALRVGSRTPVVGVPAWATPGVAHGGFATGDLLAGGDLQPYERELLSGLTLPSLAPGQDVSNPSSPEATLTLLATPCDGVERGILNGYYLSDPGIAALSHLLETGCYRVNVPEEGALLVVAWLLGRGDGDPARAVLDAIGPFLSRLRFYPVPAPTPLTISTTVALQDVAQTIRDLSAIRVPRDILAQRESVRVWAPLYDRVVELFLETVEGPAPTLRGASIAGGWPCQHYPEDWHARARAALDDYRRCREENRVCRKPDDPRRNLARLRSYLDACVQDPGRLTRRDVGLIRAILAGIVSKHGTPGSPTWQRLRTLQAAQVVPPTSVELARLLIERLSAHPRDEGLGSLEGITTPATQEEAGRHGLMTGQPIPDPLATKVRRCQAAPLPELVEAGIVPSGEVLARLVPQITAQVRAAGIVDARLRRLYGALYTAFRRRRSVLLLNLESQVRFEELPWVRVLGAYRNNDLSGQEQARQTLEQVVTLALMAFPEKILPNKLLQEVRTLAEGAGMRLPIVDEVAADIFMGAFSEKFVRAAQTAAEMLAGTLYERYYGLSYARVLQIDDIRSSPYGTPTSPAFVGLCTELAGETESGKWSVARNGKIIEQEQILTTHNLAVLFDALGLVETLKPRLRELAERCFRWVCRRLQLKIQPRHARLLALKNAAYAWRQMVFFLALLPDEDVQGFLAFASDHLDEQAAEFRTRFQPVLDGLRRSASGDQRGEARPLLGWTTAPHWLLG